MLGQSGLLHACGSENEIKKVSRVGEGSSIAELCSVLDARGTFLLSCMYSLTARLPGQLSRRLEATRAIAPYEEVRRPAAGWG